MTTEETLGAFRFQIRKSKWRLALWSLLWLGLIASIAYPLKIKSRLLTVNEWVLLGFFAFWWLICIADFWRSRVRVYENGLVHYRLLGRPYIIVFTPYMQLLVRRWCFGIWKWRFGKQISVKIHDDLHHHRIPFSFGTQNEIVVSEVENYLFKVSMHMLNQIYDAGETLHFGAVQLNRHHIEVRKKHLLRNELGLVDIRNGNLRIYAKNKKGHAKRIAFSRTPIHQIANFRLMCRFIEFNDVEIQRFAYHVYGLPRF